MKRAFFAWVMALALLLGLASVASAQPPGNYHFKLIAETGPGFLNLGKFVSLNNRGKVSFFAETAPNIRGVFAGNADEPLITIAADTGRIELGETSINDLGVVAFTTEAGDVLVGSGGPTMPVFTHTPDGGFATGIVSMNNNGSVIFPRMRSPGSTSIAYASRGTVTIIANTHDWAPGSGVQSQFINNLDTAVFTYTIGGDGGLGEFLQTSTAGAPAIRILDNNDKPFDYMAGAVINDRGTIAFVGTTGVARAMGIFMFANGWLTPLLQFGGPGLEPIINNISINNNDAIAFFWGDVPGVGPGIFTGPDRVADKVIQRGDELFNSVVSDVAFFRQGLNDSGDVAFWARLQDGRQVIVRAKSKKDKDMTSPS